MSTVVYLSLVLGVALMAIIAGFRRGFTGQLASLLGFGFGAVAARVLTPQLASGFNWGGDIAQYPEFANYAANLVCAVVIYTVVFFCFSLFSPVLKSALSVFRVGMFNRILGAFFSLIKNLLWLSIFFNLLLCCRAESDLLKYEKSNDGNLVAAIMALTPGILGCYGAEDFAHFHQLREAKTISCNFNGETNVIIRNG